MRPACSTSATATASIGSCAAIPDGKPVVFLHGGPAAGRAPTTGGSSIPKSTRSWCSTSAAAASRRLMRASSQHDLGPGRRYREAADAGREGRQMAGVRRQLGLDPRARLRRDLSRARHRTGAARHLPVRPI